MIFKFYDGAKVTWFLWKRFLEYCILIFSQARHMLNDTWSPSRAAAVRASSQAVMAGRVSVLNVPHLAMGLPGFT
jgi:hypothetical protein